MLAVLIGLVNVEYTGGRGPWTFPWIFLETSDQHVEC